MTDRLIAGDVAGVKALLEARTKRLDGYGYKLIGGPNGRYGLDVAFSDGLDIDETAMAVRFPYADGNARDGVGDLLEIPGIRLERHVRNPVVLFDHGKTVALPVGMTEDRDTGEYTVQLDAVEKVARAKAFFWQGATPSAAQHERFKSADAAAAGDRNRLYEHALFCEQLFHLVAQKFIRGGSIGYQVLRARALPADYEKGVPQGMHLQSVLQLECSVVVMPCNKDTVIKLLDMPKVCGKRLSPYLVKSLEAYAPERKAQLGYEGKAKRPSIPVDPTKPVVSINPYHTTETGHPVPEEEQGDAFIAYMPSWESADRARRFAQTTVDDYQPPRQIVDHTTGQQYHEQIVEDEGDKDLIHGGLADDKTPRDFDREQLRVGTRVELEHTSDERKAREIAMDHLSEDPDYYRKLRRMEGGKAIHHERVDAALRHGRELLAQGEDPHQALSWARVDLIHRMENEGIDAGDVEDTWAHAYRSARDLPEKGKSIKALRQKYRGKAQPTPVGPRPVATQRPVQAPKPSPPPAVTPLRQRSKNVRDEAYSIMDRADREVRMAEAQPQHSLAQMAKVDADVNKTRSRERGELRELARRGKKEIHIVAVPPVDPVEADMQQDADAGDQDAARTLQQIRDARRYETRLHGSERWRSDVDAMRHPPEGSLHGRHPDLRTANREANELAARYQVSRHPSEAPATVRYVPSTGAKAVKALRLKYRKKEIHITARPPIEPAEWDMQQDAEHGDEDARRALEAANQGRTYRVRRHGRYQGHLPGGAPLDFDHHPDGGEIPGGENIPTVEEARREAAESARLYNTHGKRPDAPDAVIIDHTRRPEQKAVNRPRVNQALHDAETMRQQGFDRDMSRLHSGNDMIGRMYDAGESHQDVVDTSRAYSRRQPEKGKAIKSLRLKYRRKGMLDEGEGLNARLQRQRDAARGRWLNAEDDVSDEHETRLADEVMEANRREAEVSAYQRRNDLPVRRQPRPSLAERAIRERIRGTGIYEPRQPTSRTWNQANEGKTLPKPEDVMDPDDEATLTMDAPSQPGYPGELWHDQTRVHRSGRLVDEATTVDARNPNRLIRRSSSVYDPAGEVIAQDMETGKSVKATDPDKGKDPHTLEDMRQREYEEHQERRRLIDQIHRPLDAEEAADWVDYRSVKAIRRRWRRRGAVSSRTKAVDVVPRHKPQTVHSPGAEDRARQREYERHAQAQAEGPAAPGKRAADIAKRGKKEIHITAHPPVEPPEWDAEQDAAAGDTAAQEYLRRANEGRRYHVRKHGREHWQDAATDEPYDHPPAGTPVSGQLLRHAERHGEFNWDNPEGYEHIADARAQAEHDRNVYNQYRHATATPATIHDHTRPPHERPQPPSA